MPQIYFVMKLYMFRTVRLSIISSLFTVHSALVYVIQALYTQLSSRSICFCSKAVYTPVGHIPVLSVHWINSWWWTDELSETCRVSWQNKFVKLVHLVSFITKKFVTMQHGHTNVKKSQILIYACALVLLSSHYLDAQSKVTCGQNSASCISPIIFMSIHGRRKTLVALRLTSDKSVAINF
jgi:hypothetical protein